MDVILRQDVEKLGQRGDAVRVKDGYARNYLIPRGLAYAAGKDAVARVQAEQKRADRKRTEDEEKILQVVQAEEMLTCTIEMKADPGGHLYASVSAAMVAEALRTESGFPFEARHVLLESPIKEIGPREVELALSPDRHVMCKVWVLEERPPAG